MGDNEVQDQQIEGDLEQEKPLRGSNSFLIKVLLYVIGAIIALILVTVVSVIVSQNTALRTYKQQRNIAIVKAPPPLDIFNFNDEFRISTADVEQTHFVRMRMSLGIDVNQPDLQLELGQRQAQIQNLVNLIITQRRKEELLNLTNQLDLRDEIKAHINHILTNGKIKEVYFKEFIVN